MTTIDELIEELAKNPRGQIFLINLYHTLKLDYLPTPQVKIACEKFLNDLNAVHHPLDHDEVVNRLGRTCVSNDLWRYGPEPILERHLLKKEFILSRVASYSGFFYSILKRGRGMPPIPDMPEPIGNNNEIDVASINTVRKTINSGKWKNLIVGDNVLFDARCIWLTSLPKLMDKIVTGRRRKEADTYRDVIGLSHFHQGLPLIRLDLNLGQWLNWPTTLRRRPHGAGNGGSRFRLQYDGPECACQWGRTVDLAHVVKGYGKSLNGIPELLMEGFSIPKTALKATYLGQLKYQPENNDKYFIKRLVRKQTISEIIMNLRSTLI